MQDRFTGDFGDFVKYALLRKLIEGEDKRLGIAWYLRPDDEGRRRKGGSEIRYLAQPEKWAELDAPLFYGLRQIIIMWMQGQGTRAVNEIDKRSLLGKGTDFAYKLLDPSLSKREERKQWRVDWFNSVKHKLATCDIVFADPDKGLCDNDKVDPEHLPLGEALHLARKPDGQKRTAIFYHNDTRSKPDVEFKRWADQLSNALPFYTYAFYCPLFTKRTFFVVNPTEPMVNRLKEFERAWQSAGRRAGSQATFPSKLFGPR